MRELGRGQFGEVYLVEGPESGALQVAKVLVEDRARATEQKEEFRLLARLDHPNLVTPWALEEYGSRLVLLMEFVRGAPFDRWVHARTEAPVARVRSGLQQLLEALQALHGHGVLHLDIKPDNVLIGADDVLHLLDFGLSRATDDAEGDVRGTLAYLAPEILMGGGYSSAADLFAAGVMAFEALTGSLPFASDGNESFTARMLSTEPATLEVDGDPALASLVRQLMEPAPEDRPDAAGALAQLRGDAIRPSRAHSRVELVGRTEELEWLAESWRQSARRPVLVHLVGASGMGKSALLDAFVDGLPTEALVLRGRCFERDTTPHQGLDTAILHLARFVGGCDEVTRERLAGDAPTALGLIFPELGEAFGQGVLPEGTPSPALRRVGIEALRRLLGRVSADRHVLLVLDDVQWGDRDSALLLLELMQGQLQGRLMVVLSHRPLSRDMGWFLAAWREGLPSIRPLVQELRLGPLPADDARRLAAVLLGSELGAARLARDAEGCPFIVEVLARAGVADSLGDAELTLLQWVGQLHGAPREMLEAICLAGRPLVRGHVPGLPEAPERRPRVWSALLRRRLVRSVGRSERVEPYHSRIQRAVVSSMDEAARERTHLALGRQFASESVIDAEAAAVHLFQGGAADEALPFAIRAAQQADAMLAFDRAATLFGLALQCAPDPGQLRELELRRAQSLANAGHAAEAAPLFLALSEQARTPRRLELQRQAMEQLLISGRVDEGRRVMERLFAALGLTTLRGWRLRLGLWLELLRMRWRGPRLSPGRALSDRQQLLLETYFSVGKGYGSYDLQLSGLYLVRATRLALETGQAGAAARGLAYLGAWLASGGTRDGVRRAEHWVGAGEALAEREEDGHALATSLVARGLQQLSVGSWRRAIDYLDRAARWLQQGSANAEWEIDTARNLALLGLWLLGELEALEERANRLVLAASQRGDLALRLEASLYLAPVLLAAGDPEAAEELVDARIGEWTQDGFHFQHWIACRFRSWTALYRGVRMADLTRLQAELARADRHRVTHMQFREVEGLQLLGSMAAQLLAAGQPTERLLRRVIKRLERVERSYARAPLLSLGAALSWHRGNREQAREQLQLAVRRYDEADMALFSASARLVLEMRWGDEAVEASARELLASSGVTDPVRWACALIPGLVVDPSTLS